MSSAGGPYHAHRSNDADEEAEWKPGVVSSFADPSLSHPVTASMPLPRRKSLTVQPSDVPPVTVQVPPPFGTEMPILNPDSHGCSKKKFLTLAVPVTTP